MRLRPALTRPWTGLNRRGPDRGQSRPGPNRWASTTGRTPVNGPSSTPFPHQKPWAVPPIPSNVLPCHLHPKSSPTITLLLLPGHHLPLRPPHPSPGPSIIPPVHPTTPTPHPRYHLRPQYPCHIPLPTSLHRPLTTTNITPLPLPNTIPLPLTPLTQQVPGPTPPTLRPHHLTQPPYLGILPTRKPLNRCTTLRHPPSLLAGRTP